jgi:hypothetical protein
MNTADLFSLFGDDDDDDDHTLPLPAVAAGESPAIPSTSMHPPVSYHTTATLYAYTTHNPRALQIPSR